MTRWCTVPKIWYLTDTTAISRFGLLFSLCYFSIILRKPRKSLEISSFYEDLPKIMTRWCTVPKIWCLTDTIVICHFGQFFSFVTPEKTKKTPGDNIILHRSAKNFDQMMYSLKTYNFQKTEKMPGDLILHTCNKKYHTIM